ncbi:MAG: CRISPR-associated endonuclease Cas1 [Chloroflexota bacterium]|nr:CRISPR-associated endonuclease Cas1 [Chloroflexota bacterium]
MSIVQNLIVEEYGTFIGKHSERLIVTKGAETLAQAPLLHLESVLIAGHGVGISADAVKECAERGIPIHFVSGTGNAYASLYSAGLTGTILTRRAQLEAFRLPRGLMFALASARGKIQNQANLMKYMGKYRKETAPELFELLRGRAEHIEGYTRELESIADLPEVKSGERATIDDWRSEIMGIEGRAAQMYWDTIGHVLPPEMEWRGREGRGARDPINSALNYAYGILYGQTERALVLAGLDPYAGFSHVDRPGKPSMTLDAIEEFRQPVVDRTIFGLVNKGVKVEQDERGYLTDETRKMLAEKVLNRLETGETYEKKNVPLRIIMQTQARHLATYLRGERAEYQAFVMEW